MKHICVVIPVYNRIFFTKRCLESLSSILKTAHYSSDVIVVDDGSTDGTSEMIEKNFPDVVRIKGDGNLWWTGGINTGLEYVINQKICDYILIMNDDISFENNFISTLLDSIEKMPNSIIGSITLYANRENTIWKAGMLDTHKLHPLLINIYQNKKRDEIPIDLIPVDSISGRSMLIPVEVFKKTGLFDQKTFPHGYADHEFCIRAREKGYNLFIDPKSAIYSEPGKDKSLFKIICDISVKDFLKTFRDIKYDWSLKSLFNIYIKTRGTVRGILGFSYHSLILIKWILLKILLRKSVLQIKVTKRIND